MFSPETALSWGNAIRDGGPWLLLVLVVVALVIRDRQLRDLYDRVIDLASAQSAAQVELANTVKALLERRLR